jgi:hypothetical protein
MVFLCGGPKPACPASGTVTGIITAADVSVLPASNTDSVIPQGIDSEDLAGLIRAFTAETATSMFTARSFPAGRFAVRCRLNSWVAASNRKRKGLSERIQTRIPPHTA